MAKKGPKIQAVPEPDGLLTSYDFVHLQCRTDRHRWNRQAHWFVADREHNERHVMCDECGTRRVAVININTYEVIGPVRYRYPRGYLTPKSGLTFHDFRTEMLQKDLANAEKTHRVEVA